MTREEYEARLADLQPATDAFARLPSCPEIIRETEKAMCLRFPVGVAEFSHKDLWFPKSQLAADTDAVFGTTVCIRKSWVSRERLWWLFQ